MFKEFNDLFQKNLNTTVKTMQSSWVDTMQSEQFLKSIKMFHIHYFDKKEETDKAMEDILENTRIASKEDIRDLVDSQRLVIDLLEDITERIEKIEQSKK